MLYVSTEKDAILTKKRIKNITKLTNKKKRCQILMGPMINNTNAIGNAITYSAKEKRGKYMVTVH